MTTFHGVLSFKQIHNHQHSCNQTISRGFSSNHVESRNNVVLSQYGWRSRKTIDCSITILRVMEEDKDQGPGWEALSDIGKRRNVLESLIKTFCWYNLSWFVMRMIHIIFYSRPTPKILFWLSGNKRRFYGDKGYLLESVGRSDIELDGDICKQARGNCCVGICLIDPIKILSPSLLEPPSSTRWRMVAMPPSDMQLFLVPRLWHNLRRGMWGSVHISWPNNVGATPP